MIFNIIDKPESKFEVPIKSPKVKFKVNTDVIKITNTFHTVGINSFSMYRHLTQLVDGIPKQTQRHDFKAFRLFKPHQDEIIPSNLE